MEAGDCPTLNMNAMENYLLSHSLKQRSEILLIVKVSTVSWYEASAFPNWICISRNILNYVISIWQIKGSIQKGFLFTKGVLSYILDETKDIEIFKFPSEKLLLNVFMSKYCTVAGPTYAKNTDFPCQPILMFSRDFYSAFSCLFYDPLLERTYLVCLLSNYCGRGKPENHHQKIITFSGSF